MFGRSKIIGETLLNLQRKITRLFWVQSQWPYQAVTKSESDKNKLNVLIFFLDSSNLNIDQNHETMMTLRSEIKEDLFRSIQKNKWSTNWKIVTKRFLALSQRHSRRLSDFRPVRQSSRTTTKDSAYHKRNQTMKSILSLK